MFENNEIISNQINKKTLTKEEKFKILRSKRIELQIKEYLINRLSALHIEVLDDYERSIFELMPVEKLEGWCWETTESAIVFLNDNDYIEKGNLKFDEGTFKYYHFWICFCFNKTEYVFDPCLNFLCKKYDYSKIFETEVKGHVTAKAVREELIRQVTTKIVREQDTASKLAEEFIKSLLGDEYYQEKKREVIVHASEDVNAPLYRNSAGYKAELQTEK